MIPVCSYTLGHYSQECLTCEITYTADNMWMNKEVCVYVCIIYIHSHKHVTVLFGHRHKIPLFARELEEREIVALSKVRFKEKK